MYVGSSAARWNGSPPLQRCRRIRSSPAERSFTGRLDADPSEPDLAGLGVLPLVTTGLQAWDTVPVVPEPR